MIIKTRSRNKQLDILEALQHRTPLTPFQQSLLRSLKINDQLEQEFEQYIPLLDRDGIDIIWQFNYSDYHQEALINVLVISDKAIYLFKLNHYNGLHYINHNGMLCDYVTDEVKMDLVQLNCVKYSIYHMLNPDLKKLPIYIKAVCLNDSFMLDVHSDHHYFLYKKDITHYLSHIKGSGKKKRLPNV